MNYLTRLFKRKRKLYAFEPAFWMNLSKNYHDKKGDKMSNELTKEKLWKIEQLQTRIAELEADNANLNDWLNAWKESFNLAQAEIAKLHADNRSLVEQMNQMALKPNQAVIEYFYPKHNPENRRIENLPTEECPCIVELYSGEYDIVWWIDGGFEETGWDGYCVDEIKSWAYLPKGVTK